MTKEFCDHCGVEINNSNRMMISIRGNASKDFIFRNVLFCELCFCGIEKEINKYMPARAEAIA